MSVLDVDNLRTTLNLNGRACHALRDVSFRVAEGETLAIVGESGCGKSMLAMSIMGLLPSVARITQGHVVLDGRTLEKEPERAMEKIRGARIGMVFQEPMTALNPVFTVGAQISEPLRDHLGLSRRDAREAAIELMEKVRIPSAASRYTSYPHEFSGGMRQRVVIALAIACGPRLLIADEPTTALDVTVQRQLLDLLDHLQDEGRMGMLLITHNLAIVAGHADRVVVMYGGDVVESATVRDLFRNPAHPYARALLASLPRVDRDLSELASIPGRVPPLAGLPDGCRFKDRCPHAMDICEQMPPPTEMPGEAGHNVRCWLHVEGGEHAADG
ncbi:peptide ABC transporter ATP-binding protein [Salipiger aestuarii]|uniref:ABC transporter ATP-binding protein n=1 Tax=Salipiger aestuarii TaxID=568098 RepID=UPI00025B6A05|nr:ABC transporter ATP-binding protein [Salipiger aestuarii]EIE51529.1 oligopeptide/dipeptide ABC transporter, ATPase subunit [Citreicella sp. 357]KAA8608454.1 peptide ABC transporter ATP-binding protein [Salipiger aestuarii]